MCIARISGRVIAKRYYPRYPFLYDDRSAKITLSHARLLRLFTTYLRPYDALYFTINMRKMLAKDMLTRFSHKISFLFLRYSKLLKFLTHDSERDLQSRGFFIFWFSVYLNTFSLTIIFTLLWKVYAISRFFFKDPLYKSGHISYNFIFSRVLPKTRGQEREELSISLSSRFHPQNLKNATHRGTKKCAGKRK